MLLCTVAKLFIVVVAVPAVVILTAPPFKLRVPAVPPETAKKRFCPDIGETVSEPPAVPMAADEPDGV